MEKKDPRIFRDLGSGSEQDLALQGRECPRIPGTGICIIPHLKWENSSIQDPNTMGYKLKTGNGIPAQVLNLGVETELSQIQYVGNEAWHSFSYFKWDFQLNPGPWKTNPSKSGNGLPLLFRSPWLCVYTWIWDEVSME